MNAKLTLKLNEAVIEKAKKYAQKNRQSLSELVENYFKALTDESGNEQDDYGALTTELSGVINAADIENYKEKYTEYLAEKYQ
jgi:hypothetical protein